ncbi:MAG: hypothetical protein D8G53_11885 [Candidatus Saccharimonas sp.]|nr:MAG: hypothetical protein D8G53_11885 [Candidatus Saccharimonas sp.]
MLNGVGETLNRNSTTSICGKNTDTAVGVATELSSHKRRVKTTFCWAATAAGQQKSDMYFFTGQKAILQEIFDSNLFFVQQNPIQTPASTSSKTIFRKKGEVVFAFGRN